MFDDDGTIVRSVSGLRGGLEAKDTEAWGGGGDERAEGGRGFRLIDGE